MFDFQPTSIFYELINLDFYNKIKNNRLERIKLFWKNCTIRRESSAGLIDMKYRRYYHSRT